MKNTGAAIANTFEDLVDAARSAPIVSSLGLLEKKILESGYSVDIVEGVDEFWRQFYNPNHLFESDIIINDTTGSYHPGRDLSQIEIPELEYMSLEESAYNPQLNKRIGSGEISWKDVSDATLNQSNLSDLIVNKSEELDVIAFVVVDGLSYRDWIGENYNATPVYVDCPSITECGYPNAILGGDGNQSLASKLHSRGFKNRLAFTYWDKDQSELTELLHTGFSQNDVIGDVISFEDVVTHLKHSDWNSNFQTYIQITLTGPERVAHQMKEHPNVSAEVQAIYRKLKNLKEYLNKTTESYGIFATSDHGMLWRKYDDDRLCPLNTTYPNHMRRCIETSHKNVQEDPDFFVDSDLSHTETWNSKEYIRLEYPHLFHDLRSNEPGVHGGYSYQECIVPFIKEIKQA